MTYHKSFYLSLLVKNSAQCHEGRANYNRTEAIKQTTFFVVTQSFKLSCDLQTTHFMTHKFRMSNPENLRRKFTRRSMILKYEDRSRGDLQIPTVTLEYEKRSLYCLLCIF